MDDSRQSPEDLTLLLGAWKEGDKGAEDQLFRYLEGQLKRMCRKHLRGVDHPVLTMEQTEMFHELYMRLDAQTKNIDWANRGHFFYIAGRIARQIIIDEVRRKKSGKRKADVHTYTDILPGTNRRVEVGELELALKELESQSPELARVVDYRFFVGLGYGEIAKLTGQAENQIRYQWTKAKAWLLVYLNRNHQGEGFDG